MWPTSGAKVVAIPFTRDGQGVSWPGGTKPVSEKGTHEGASKGAQFGPEPHHYDPYDGMTDEELESELDDILRREPASVTISIRMPAELLERTKRLAADGGMPYQALIKRLVDAGVSRLEQRARR